MKSRLNKEREREDRPTDMQTRERWTEERELDTYTNKTIQRVSVDDSAIPSNTSYVSQSSAEARRKPIG